MINDQNIIIRSVLCYLLLKLYYFIVFNIGLYLISVILSDVQLYYKKKWIGQLLGYYENLDRLINSVVT